MSLGYLSFPLPQMLLVGRLLPILRHFPSGATERRDYKTLPILLHWGVKSDTGMILGYDVDLRRRDLKIKHPSFAASAREQGHNSELVRTMAPLRLVFVESV